MSFSLFRRGKVWHYRFQVAGRPRVQRSTGEEIRTKAEAVAAKAHADALLRARGDEPCPTLRELVAMWLEAHAKVHSESHLEAMRVMQRNHLYGLADLRLDQFTTANVEEARNLHLLTHAPSSCNQWVSMLRLLVNWAIRRRMLRVRDWEVKMIKTQKRPRVILPVAKTLAWLEAFDAANEPSLRLAVRLAQGMGLRESEALGGRWEWLDFERGLYTPGRTKERHSTPRPVPAWLLEYLRPLAKPQGLMAPRNGQDRPHPPGALRKAMRAANVVVEIVGLTPHRLRGSYATHLSEAGVPIQDIQRVLGHQKLATTLGYLEVDLNRVTKGQDSIRTKTQTARRESGAPDHAEAHQT